MLVDIRWRPSGGRGEYEHVPQSVLLNRNLVIKAVSVPAALVMTDVWGRIKDGKPRLRRENPNDHSVLNIAPLIAALALLPDPRREDHGSLALPLRDKGYVISSVTVDANPADHDRMVCTPQKLQVLHDPNAIDLVLRLVAIGAFLERNDLPVSARRMADRYIHIVKSGIPSAELRTVADSLITWLNENPEFAESIEEPSENFVESADANSEVAIEQVEMTAVETKRRLVSHYKIDRSRTIRKAKIHRFKEAHGSVFCENCSFNFGTRYGERGEGYIEVHHLLPLAALLPNSITSLSDLMLLCSNCHRMVHRKLPLLGALELRKITRF